MGCVSPRVRKYYEAMYGQPRQVEFGCGKCCSCLAAKQDEISIRIQETARDAKYFVYDTLTFAPENMTYDEFPDLEGRLLRKESVDIISKYYPDGFLPVFPKHIFSMWLKQGRERYNKRYRKQIELGNMTRLKIKYLVVMEYGPVSSRPHAHLIMFGISRNMYDKYFGKPWNKKYGFNERKFIDQRVSDKSKDCFCISRYISKYVSKGVFESPLVKDGLQPPPWRQLSHGIGEEYLTRVALRFAFLKTADSEFRKSIHPFDFYVRYDAVHEKNIVAQRSGFATETPGLPIGWNLTKSQIISLTTYFDDAGYPHRLPRYYFDKLLGSRANLLRYEVQTALQCDAEQRRNKEISEYAASFGCIPEGDVRPQAEILELFRSDFPLLYMSWLDEQKNKRIRKERGNFVKLSNHYKRTKIADPSIYS